MPQNKTDLFGRKKMVNPQLIAYVQCLVNRGLKLKKIFVTGLKNTIGFLEIATDALRKRSTLIINRCVDGICWNFLIAVLIKMCFFRKVTSRKLEAKNFDIL